MKPTVDSSAETEFYIDPTKLETTILKCPIIGTNNITWPRVNTDSGTLQLSREGYHKCIGSNEAGTAEFTFKVIALVQPYNLTSTLQKVNNQYNGTEAPETLKLKLHESISIICSSYGVPKPEIVWLFNSEAVIVGNDILELTANNINQRGIYTCQASNGFGLLKKSFEIIIESPPVYEQEESQFVSVLYGNKISLNCETKAYPKPSIYWYKDS